MCWGYGKRRRAYAECSQCNITQYLLTVNRYCEVLAGLAGFYGHRQRGSCFGKQLQHGLDARVDGEVRDAGAADDVGFARDMGEMQEAAKVVILVEDVEERLGFRGTELKCGEGDGLAELTRDGEVAVHYFAKAQHRRTKHVMGLIPQ